MATSTDGAIEALRDAKSEISRLFGTGPQSGAVSEAWQRARREWDDDVAIAVESQVYVPLLREALSLASQLEELAHELEKA